ncbi:MAG: class I SAM-dependent methyltransferase [Nitrospinales bacterium]
MVRNVARSNAIHPLVFLLLLILLLLNGCNTIKRSAYEGFERDSWQYPDRVIQTLGIQSGDVIADLGAGSGYFTFRLAEAVGPQGKVYAVDVDQAMNEYLKEKILEKGVKNIEVILAEYQDPLLPDSGVDLIFTSNTYHHLEERSKYFSNARKYLRPKGRMAIIEFKKYGWFQKIFGHFTPGEVIRNEMKAAGFHVEKEYDFLPMQHFMVFIIEQEEL